MNDPPGDWTTWHAADEGRVVLAFRPDTFDAERYPAACLPTVHVSDGSPRRRRGGSGRWTATLRLEPDVTVASETRPDRPAALAAARDLAARFDAGEFDLRGAYRVVEDRGAYLDRLDDLTGRS